MPTPEQQVAAIQKLSDALVLAARELANIATMDEDAPQSSVAAGAQLRAKAQMEEALSLLEGD